MERRNGGKWGKWGKCIIKVVYYTSNLRINTGEGNVRIVHHVKAGQLEVKGSYCGILL